MKNYAPLVLRIGLGGLFLTAGIMKLIDPTSVVKMLSELGFPVAIFWAWLLILTEMLFGAALVTGLKIKWTTIPLVIVLIVAIIVNITTNIGVVLTNTALLFCLAALWMLGPGKISLAKK